MGITRNRSVLAGLATALALLPGSLLAQQADTAQLETTVDDGFTIAVVGDIIISYPLDHMLADPGLS